MKKFWKMIIPDFKFRTNVENLYNSFRKTKSRPGVKMEEKNRPREERHKVGKVKLLN